ncbi:MAG: ATP-binding protein [Gammaproteobacteria bacterium]|nr:ATP-binding protein [Gammaproteobacteria bacterium]
MGAPWYGVFLWVTLGNGFRYGEKYLYLSCIASLGGFGAVVASTPYWSANIELAIGLAITLLVIPAYSGILIRRLNEALQRADTASRAKSDFLSCMSHEIRTPLNGILGMADLLRLRPLAADDKECVDTIHASGQALARQINDILDLSKIEAGELTLENIEFDLYALVNTTLRIFQPQVAAKQLQLRENLDPRTPYLLHGDPHKLRQVIINLVGNALKFTEQGFVTVSVYPREYTDDRVLLRFEIADTGIGIPPERQAAIFEPFTQADNSVSRSYGGTGLGTTICKNIVELMGGEIGIQSTPGVGTTFWFDISFSAEDRQASGTRLAWAGDCKVLYIESGTGNGISRELDTWGIAYDTATTLEHAAKLLECRNPSEPYDAVVIENARYSNELISLLTDIEESAQLKHTSVIMITDGAFISEDDVCKHDRLYVLNPESDKNILLNTLHASYSRHSTEEDIVHIAHHQVRAQTSPRSLEVLIADDNATNRIVLQRMLEKLGHQCDLVNGGTAALEQLEEGHYDAVIIDKNMPDLGGVETYQAYSLAHGGNPPVEFIVLTADATEESREACRSAGIGLFMTKPVSLVKLQETLATVKATGQAITQESVAEKEPADLLTEQDSDALPVINETEFESLVRLAGDNRAFITDLISNFETDAGNDIRGLEAAIANHDLSKFRDFAHALKGGALYLGLSKLAQLSLEAQQIEEDNFRRTGVACVQALQQAADDAISSLHDRESALQVIG